MGLGSFKPVTAEGAEVGFVVNERTKSGKALDVALGMKPEFQITAFRVFLVQMSEGTLVKGFEIGFGKHLAAVRHRSMDDGKRVNLPIGFCNDGAKIVRGCSCCWHDGLRLHRASCAVVRV